MVSGFGDLGRLELVWLDVRVTKNKNPFEASRQPSYIHLWPEAAQCLGGRAGWKKQHETRNPPAKLSGKGNHHGTPLEEHPAACQARKTCLSGLVSKIDKNALRSMEDRPLLTQG